MTSVPGIFAAGNVAVVFDLVDYVAQSGEIAARGAMKYIRGQLDEKPDYFKTVPAGNINFIVPQRLVAGNGCDTQLFMRVKSPDKKAQLLCEEAEGEIYRKKYPFVAPPEMISCTVSITGQSDVTVDMKEGENHG